MPSVRLEARAPSSPYVDEPGVPAAHNSVEASRPRFRSKQRRSVWRYTAAGIAVAAVIGGVAFKLRPASVTTTPIVRGDAVEAAYATGTVEAFDRVLVKAKATGTVDLKVREGARVKKGDLLAVIDSPTLRHELDRGNADLQAAALQAGPHGPQLVALEAQARAIQADLTSAEHDGARYADLVSQNAVPQIELDHVRDKTAALRAQLEANVAQQHALMIELSTRRTVTNAEVGSLAARLADAEVRSPLDGVVLARFIEPGEVAMLNAPLLKVGTDDHLVLECAIDEADIGRVTVGKKVAVSLYAFRDTVFDGEVFDILPDADRAKKSYLAKVSLAKPPAGLRSGMTAEVNVIIQDRPGTPLVPAEAVDADGHVMVVVGGRLQQRTPKLGVRDMLRVEVVDGLAEGESVVVAGGEGLTEGARVTATVRPPADGLRTPKGSSSGLTL
jgi:RND family efflux transporter MFP subunit